MNKKELVEILGRKDFGEFYSRANKIRETVHGDVVHIRGIIEFSNYCRRKCAYCGLNATNEEATRYRMTPEEIIETGYSAYEAGYKTLVLQSGEDPYFTKDILGDIVAKLKETGISITLSCGERDYETLKYWRHRGADRYLLKHETSDVSLYNKLHPCGTLENRKACLRNIKELGYETGSGFMIGLPNQTLETVASDLLMLKELSCDMAGIGPFIPHPKTPLKDTSSGSTELTKRAVALARILMPKIHLPATTALGVRDIKEKNDVFSCGANVIMLKVTPDKYKYLYEIYPSNLPPTDILNQRKTLEKSILELNRIPV